MNCVDYGQLPTFFVLGVQKAGTTTLYSHLAQHPAIDMAYPKEPHFFDLDERYVQGVDYYVTTYFANALGCAQRGEATPDYFSVPKIVIPRFQTVYNQEQCRNLKFIVSLREPVARAWSSYQQAVKAVLEDQDFATALKLEPMRARQDPVFAQYYAKGCYASHLRQWFAHFDRTQFHFLLLEDIASNPAPTLASIYRFLEVDDQVHVDSQIHRNRALHRRWWRFRRFVETVRRARPITHRLLPSQQLRMQLEKWLNQQTLVEFKEPPRIPPEIAARLHNAYRPEIMQLAQMIDRDLSQWLVEPS